MLIHAGIQTTDKSEFDEIFSRVSRKADCVHVDIADGKMVPYVSVSLDKIVIPSGVNAELHMMVMNPLSLLDSAKTRGFSRVIVHRRSLGSLDDSGLINFIDYAHEFDLGVVLGLEINEKFPSYEVLERVEGVQFMTIRLGFPGTSFVRESVDSVVEFHRQHEDVMIQVDGGINDATVGYIKNIGVGAIVSTSWLSLSDEFEYRYDYLKKYFD